MKALERFKIIQKQQILPCSIHINAKNQESDNLPSITLKQFIESSVKSKDQIKNQELHTIQDVRNLEAQILDLESIDLDNLLENALFTACKAKFHFLYNKTTKTIRCDCGTTYKIKLINHTNKYKIFHTGHSNHEMCKLNLKIPTNVKDMLLFSNEFTFDTPEFWDKIENSLGREVSHRTFIDRYNILSNSDKRGRQKSFSKLYNVYKYVNDHGGYASIITKDGKIFDDQNILQLEPGKEIIIDSFSMIPPVCKFFIKSKGFNKLLLVDTTHIDSIAGGNIGILATTLPSRTPLPLSFGWGKSENKGLITIIFKNFLKVLKSDSTDKEISEDDISYIISDKGTAIDAALTELNLSHFHILCLFHLANNNDFFHFKSEIMKLTEALTEEEWDDQVNQLKIKFQNYYSYDESKISDFVSDLLQTNPYRRKKFDHGLIASSIIESMNSYLKLHNLNEVIDWINHICMYCYDKIYSLFSNTGENHHITKIEEEIEKDLKNWDINRTNIPRFYLVNHLARDNITHEVIFNSKTDISCSCNFSKRYGIPCVHIRKFLNKFNQKFDLDVESIGNQIPDYFKQSLLEQYLPDIKDLNINLKNIRPSFGVRPEKWKNRRNLRKKRVRGFKKV